ncbi:MAG: hypothetical protein DRP71_16875 [Verrucomicrobia bacterium]|nr:MAG: hypothetical protein DRP71_16875 [Verrucomicrobiota bacterium]
MNKFFMPVLFLFVFLSVLNPSHAQKVGLQGDGSIVVPTNQILRPAGFQMTFPGRPVDLALVGENELRQYLVVKNIRSLDLIRVRDRVILQTLPYGKSGASFTGLEVSLSGKRIFVTEARDRVHVAALDENHNMSWEAAIVLPEPEIGGPPVPGGLRLSDDEKTLYVTLSRNNALGVVDLEDQSVHQIPVGIAPYDVLLRSAQKAYVSNWGGRRPEAGDFTSTTSGSEVVIDPETGIANSGTVSVIDLEVGQQTKSIEVGLHPTEMVLSPDRARLFVACANSDIISVIDTGRDEVVEEINVRLKKDLPFGSAPNALAISGDGNTLYVANGTDNAVCVIDVSGKGEVVGFIPVGWYPGAVALNASGTRLFIANTKGIGSINQPTIRMNAASKGSSRIFTANPRASESTDLGIAHPGYNSRDYMGSVSIIAVPDEKQLQAMTKMVEENNSMNVISAVAEGFEGEGTVPVPAIPGQVSHFKHVVYIIKENRTYDQIFGDMAQGNGDPNLLFFGRDVTPNHHKLAEDFVLMDNYYCSGVLSADGHQWTNEAYVTDYLEKFFGGFTRSYPYDGDDALAYASSGFIWDNVLRNGLTFRNYGEFVDEVIEPEGATFMDIYNDFRNGTNKVKIGARANLKTLEPYICPTSPGFTNLVPDVYRAREFIRELREFEMKGQFPNFVIMLLPNDHTSGTKPGLPTPNAAVADNDLALGQIVEAISKSQFWKETCIFVTEDDPQAGLDHVDGHRTVGFVISPYTKRGEVVSTYYTQINMVRTMENILGLEPMNQFDWVAEPMLDCFTDAPDFTPYTALPNNVPLDELNPELHSLKGDALRWAEKSLAQDLSEVDRIEEDTFNRIIWHAVRGYDVPYPNSEED